MTTPELTDHVIFQGRALVRAIEALDTIEPGGPLEIDMKLERDNG